ncbi:MAG: 23S rRNA (guanosine(2251)-2'-O)-methyltransferase RlmB [Bacilli bacterium]|nr:23S rRNA (guanosine(2251)-2'-O)-methyltransferase RlmB [Bacilli bacterium]MBN2696462.1 23S rRNA (guanosine(2251)-2'-O)-methyltransferase RlmB [Bacilli bacterium]
MSIILYGKNPVLEILNTNRTIQQAYILENSNRDLYERLQERGVPITVMNRKRFDERFTGVNQGIVIEVENYKILSIQEMLEKIDLASNPLILMLDQIQDPHNFGAIIRSAEAGGVGAIIIPKNRSVSINATVVKAASGAIEYIDIVEVINLNQAVETLKKAGFWIVGTSLDAKQSYEEIYVDRPVCLVIGNEGKGMSRLLKEHCDLLVKIPMVGKINSLNASVGTAIIIFDILRRKK